MSDIIIRVTSATPEEAKRRLGSSVMDTDVAVVFGVPFDPRVFDGALYLTVTDAT